MKKREHVLIISLILIFGLVIFVHIVPIKTRTYISGCAISKRYSILKGESHLFETDGNLGQLGPTMGICADTTVRLNLYIY